MSSEKIALAACSGMSPYGLVARVTRLKTRFLFVWVPLLPIEKVLEI